MKSPSTGTSASSFFAALESFTGLSDISVECITADTFQNRHPSLKSRAAFLCHSRLLASLGNALNAAREIDLKRVDADKAVTAALESVSTFG
jgi:hypothetical protein